MLKEKRKFLLALDGSDQSTAAVNYMAAMLPSRGTEIVLFNVLSQIPEVLWDLMKNPDYDDWAAKMGDMEKENLRLLKIFMDQSRKKFMNAGFSEDAIDIRIQNRVVGLARDIVAETKKGYTALAIGRTGTGKHTGLLLGSIASKILGALAKETICLVVGQPDPRKILVAMDGSPGAMKAVDYVADLFGGSNKEVILFHAMRHLGFPFMMTGDASRMKKIEKMFWSEDQEVMEQVFKDAKARLFKAGFKAAQVRTKIIKGVTSRAVSLTGKAITNVYGTLVVGRTGVSQVDEFNIGRVCNKVIHHAENMAVWVIA
jgi:nucleotide-binding universal stress UspA family protein